MGDKFTCIECGKLVSPKEFHDHESCKQYKLSRKLVGISKFQDELKNALSQNSEVKDGKD